MRGVEVFLNTLSGASMYRLRAGNAKIGVDKSTKVSIFSQRLDSKSLYLTGNTSTLYAQAFLDTETDGPTVIEVPPGMLGAINDAWFRYVEDLGVIGPDEGRGGKYLVLPPGYRRGVPAGYFVVRPKTFWTLAMVRGSTAQGLKHEVDRIEAKLRIYPLAKAKNPAEDRIHRYLGQVLQHRLAQRFRLLRGSESADSEGADRLARPGDTGGWWLPSASSRASPSGRTPG